MTAAEPSQPSVEDDLFPSGEWTGFYTQHGARYRQDLVLTFRDGAVSGSGSDSIGAFTIRGHFDRAALEATWTKTYRGAHSVHYRGFREGKGIWGTWELASWERGGFQIWPRRHGEVEATHEQQQASEPAAVPQPALPPTAGATDP